MAHILFVTCPQGAEDALASEITALGAAAVRRGRSGVSCRGELETAYRVVLWSRVASRVLLQVADARAASADDLYAVVRSVRWEEHVGTDGTIAVDFVGSLPGVRNSMFGAQRAKDAIADRFRDLTGGRPSVDTVAPDLRVNVSAGGGRLRVALDLAGDALHRRGYRTPGEQVIAPMKENLAAAILTLAGWRRIAERGGGFCDPMCGSGTLPIEAAMIAGDIAPGLLRDRHAVERMLGFDAGLWRGLLAEAGERRVEGAAAIPPVAGSDIDTAAIALARASAERAGLADSVRFDVLDVGEASPPPGARPGLVVVNPPYGERLAEAPAAHARLGAALGARFGGWRCALLAPSSRPPDVGSVAWKREHPLKNGPLDVVLHVGDVPERARPSRPASREVSAEEFANRLRKNARHLGKWARREGVTCWRLYDADLPDFALAIDRYESAGRDEGRLSVHVAEYEAPREIDPGLARARLDAAVAAIVEVLGVGPDEVFVKVRRRQRGSSQYERESARHAVRVVAEGGSLLEVNLSDYAGTGLFLDHRPLRARVREEAAGRRVLNLFGYTGAFTVHAAAGGAVSTVTVDLSQTYLDWARRSMALGGHTGAGHAFVRADAREWLERGLSGERFDLAVLDPPSFSNSARMEGVLDIQRDHPALVRAAASLLAPGGVLYFSTNLRKFSLDPALAEELTARDISASTIPPDFARDPKVHRCWRIEAG